MAFNEDKRGSLEKIFIFVFVCAKIASVATSGLTTVFLSLSYETCCLWNNKRKEMCSLSLSIRQCFSAGLVQGGGTNGAWEDALPERLMSGSKSPQCAVNTPDYMSDCKMIACSLTPQDGQCYVFRGRGVGEHIFFLL